MTVQIIGTQELQLGDGLKFQKATGGTMHAKVESIHREGREIKSLTVRNEHARPPHVETITADRVIRAWKL